MPDSIVVTALRRELQHRKDMLRITLKNAERHFNSDLDCRRERDPVEAASRAILELQEGVRRVEEVGKELAYQLGPQIASGAIISAKIAFDGNNV